MGAQGRRDRLPAQSQQVLPVAVRAGERRLGGPDQAGARQSGEGEVADLGQGGGAHRLIADHAPAAVGFGLAGLELRLDERDQDPAGLDPRPDGGQHGQEGNERKVHHDGVELRPRQADGVEAAGVDLLEIGDARIGPEPGVELAPADVHADDGRGAALERAIGEPARRGADVEDVGPPQVERKALQGGGELLAAPADEAGRSLEPKRGLGRIFPAGFVEPLRAAENSAGHDQALGLGAGLGPAARDQKFVQPQLGRRGHGLCRCGDRRR